jgi:hypothetical protein
LRRNGICQSAELNLIQTLQKRGGKMTKKFLVFCLLSFSVYPYFSIKSQPWSYNFGTGTGTFDTEGSESTSFLPAPQTNGGTSLVALCTGGGGSFNLENPGVSGFGSDTELRGVASSTSYSPVNKFSIYNFNATNLFTIRFNMRFEGGDTGIWWFFCGSGSQTYTGSTSAAGSDVFAGLAFEFDAGDAINTEYRNDGTWTSLGIGVISKNINYTIDIYANNSGSTQNYNYNGSQSVAPDKFDLWVNGVLIGNDFNKDGFANGSSINAFTFHGANSNLNDAEIYIDDIYYTNGIASEPLPVELTSFTAEAIRSQVQLNWTTETEVMNYGFEIERALSSATTLQWEKIGFVAGSGNSNSPKEYSYTDKTVQAGKYFYRLKQIDTDGSFEYFPNTSGIKVDLGEPKDFTLKQNYPNPFNPETKIVFSLPVDSRVSLKIFNVLGEKIADAIIDKEFEAGVHEYIFDGSKLPSGIYFYSLETDKFYQMKKMLVVK